MTNNLPKSIEAFIQATNKHNTDEFLATMTDDAVITDESQDYRGISAIKNWSDEKYIGAKVTLEPINAVNRDGKFIVTFKVDGDFDKTGLPDPFLMDYHFISNGSKINALNIRLADE
ncbi:MAG: nuclear transport factor 2 family protein [Pyrinomonadaceae bacterium]|nr:nuclear transport factor 2 family protein [Pyrinomonadaceae bacterium]